MASSSGRRVVLSLTNKSGGGVIPGDVVIIDTANNDAFTTTTSAAYTGMVGIVQETIANNATGRVLLSGYAALVNVNASVTRGNFGTTHTVAKQATDGGSTRLTGGFCQFLTGGTTPDAHVFGMPDGSSATGNVATDPIWDAAGDLAVGSGVNTAARLAIGAAGGAVSRVNGVVAWNSGTAFPTAATGDRFWRTDLGLEFYYDGTRWLTVELFAQTMAYQDSLAPTGTTSGGHIYWPIAGGGTSDVWVDRIVAVTTVNSPNSGTQFWTVAWTRRPSATSLGSFNTSADTAGTATFHTVTVGALTGTSDKFIDPDRTKTSTPGTIYIMATIFFRLVGT